MRAWSYLITRGNKAPRVHGQRLRLLEMIPRAGVLFLASLGCAVWGPFHVCADQDIVESPQQAIHMDLPRPHLKVGERLTFHGRWLGIPVGSGWIEVKEQTVFHGSPAYFIEMEGHSNRVLSTVYPIHDVIRCYLDVQTLRPLSVEKRQREGHYRAEEIVVFDYDRQVATYRSLLNQSVKEIPISADTLDIVGAFYWLRTRVVNLTQPMNLKIYSDERVYHTEIRPLKTLRLALFGRGSFPCVLLEPQATFKGILVRRGRIWFYFSADEQRVPLLAKMSTPWGSMTAVIDSTSLHPPALHASETAREGTGS